MKMLARIIIVGIAFASILVFLVVSSGKNVDHGTSDGTSIILSP